MGWSGCEGSCSGWRFSRIDAMRHVREQNTGGLEYRRYVFKQAFSHENVDTDKGNLAAGLT